MKIGRVYFSEYIYNTNIAGNPSDLPIFNREMAIGGD